jgi:hypothetical protein
LPDPTPSCRLCGAPTRAAFRARLLSHEIQYYSCGGCGSLQTERPYWLEEAYEAAARSTLDTGAANRILDCCALTVAVRRLFGCRGKVLDFAGGEGLLCRLLRDLGIDAYTQDKYATVTFGKGFTAELDRSFETVTAFEVFEHFVDPAAEFAPLFDAGPKVILATTQLYTGQGPGWRYLSPETGQHVFFYAEGAVRAVARHAGYEAFIASNFLLFSREPISRVQRSLLARLTPRVLRGVRAYLQLVGRPGIERDFRSAQQASS